LELVECVENFDENDKPITVILSKNRGGASSVRELVEYLLMPTTVSTPYVYAAKKTPVSRFIAVNGDYIYFSSPDKCENSVKYDVVQFWNPTEYDDFGDGVIHTRTKKFYMSEWISFYPFAKYALKKHIRKPTEIILATDGFCFSSCGFFVNDFIRSGSAIVSGYGVTMPGDELFAAGQCPSSVINPGDFYSDLKGLNTKFGLIFRTTYLESYNISEKMNEKIPGDYDILRIDKHCGYYKNLKPITADLLKQTTAVYEEFKTKCNPLNKRLFLVTDECKSKDSNALYSGYMCGSNGEWDKATCKISSCKPGYMVDFDNNKCVPNPCDPRGASNALYPMITVLLATLVLAIHNIF